MGTDLCQLVRAWQCLHNKAETLFTVASAIPFDFGLFGSMYLTEFPEQSGIERIIRD